MAARKSAMTRPEEDLQYRADLEHLVAGLSAKFINLPSGEIDDGINEALQSIGNFAGSARCSLFLLSENGTIATNTHEWAASPADSQILRFQGIPASRFAHYRTLFERKGNIAVNSPEELPEEAREDPIYVSSARFRPLLFIPMYLQKRLYGILGLYGMAGEKREWPGSFVTLLSFVADILLNALERKKYEQALRKSEEEYRLLVENQTDLIVKVDMKGRFLFVSPSYCALFGKTEVELLGHEFMTLVHPEDREATAKAMEDLARPPFTCRVTLRAMAKDGWRWLDWVDTAVFGEDGRQEAIAGIGRDVTEKMKTEEELRRSKAFLETIESISVDGMTMMDRDGTVLWHNQHVTNNYGDIIGKKCFRVFRNTDVRCADCVHPAVYRDGEPRDYEAAVFEKDGGEKTVWVCATPVRDGKGKIHAVLETSRDITERKRAERERHNLEAQVQHAQKLESLGVLAGGIAHDFNNLLMGILGNADLALEDLPLDSPVRRSVEEIETGAKRAADLCRQMLAYSGKGKFVVELVDLREIVREMSDLLEVSISKRVALRYDFAGGIPPIKADATQMRQIIMNLIINASEAIGDESGEIVISVGTEECGQPSLSETYLGDGLQPGTYVYVEVADTGSGMDEETQERVFEPFFTTKFTGRGLGMAAVLGIVRSHKGAIKVRSKPGRGSSFKVYYPALAQPARRERPGSADDGGWIGQGCILLVDDEKTVRDVGKRMLERKGFSVLVARDGREAIEIFRRRKDDILCVLLDLTMPRMNGDEAFRELVRIKKDVRVIISSGYGEQDVIGRFGAEDLAGFIQKPYKSEEMFNLIRKATMGAG